MKAVLLVGGEGTRLRPLTVNTPKPLLPLVNRPFLDHVLYLLKTHGITDVVLAMAYRAENFEHLYGSGSHLGMSLTYVREEQPMGTGGAIKNVEQYLELDETFVVFNGDILTDLDLSDMLRYHKENSSVCSISLTPVEDPSAYGVVDMTEEGRITRFTEKPSREEATSNWINAGTYVLEPSVLARIPEGEHHMVERGLFPNLLADGRPLFGYRTGAYWLDIGTPAKYLQAHADLLTGKLKYHMTPGGPEMWEGVWAGEDTLVDAGARVTGPVVFGRGCRVSEGASIVGPAVLGDNCRVGRKTHLERVVAWEGAQFEERAEVRDSISGRGSRIGPDCKLAGASIVGDGAVLGAGNVLDRGAKIQCDANIPERAITF